MAAILICGATLFTACTQDDNPVDAETGASRIAMIVKNGEIDYFRQIETSFREVCQEKDLEALYYATSAENAYEEQLTAVEELRKLDNKKLKGIIFTPSYGPNGESAEAEVAALALELDIPVVILDSPVRVGSPLASCPYIGTDNTAAGEAMAAKVAADKVALFATTNSPGMERAEAIKKLKPNAVIYQVGDKANEEIQAVLDEYNDFVFFNGNILVDAIPMLKDAGKQVYTFDIYGEFLEEMFKSSPMPKGIMAQNTFEMARKAVEAVLTNATQGEMVPTFYITQTDLRTPVVQPFLKFYYKEAYATIDGLYYILNYDDKTARVTAPDNTGHYEGDIVVPDYVVQDGIKFAVTAIGDGAFSHITINSLQLPKNTLKRIGSMAFNDILGLTTLEIPESVTTLDEGAIEACRELESITVDEGNKHFATFDGVLMDKAQTRIITYPAKLAATTYTVPATVKTIDKRAFRDLAYLTSVTIPASVSKLEYSMFYQSYSLNEINIDPANTAYRSEDGVVYTADMDTLIVYPAGKTSKTYTVNASVKAIGQAAFSYANHLETLTLPEGLTTIEDAAFTSCESLKEVNLPESVTKIGMAAFTFCRKLESLVFPPHITEITMGFFIGCTALRSVTIPAELTTIGKTVFTACPSLTEITCLCTTPPAVDLTTFLSVKTNTISLYVPDESVDLYKATPIWKGFNVKGISESSL